MLDLHQVIKELLRCEADPSLACTVDQMRWAPLHHASQKGHVAIVRDLLDAKADPNVTQSSTLATPLHFACLQGHEAVARVLVAHGADPTRKTSRRATAQNFAEGGHPRIAKWLADVRDFTLLHWACFAREYWAKPRSIAALM